MSWANILTVYLKELRDLLRDRRTVMSMIIIPTILMPGLTMSTIFMAVKIATKARAATPTVIVVGGDDSPRAKTALARESRFKIVPTPGDWKQRIVDKKVGAAVIIPPGFDAALDRSEAAKVTIYNYQGELRSGFAAGDLRDFFSKYREGIVAARLTARGLPPSLVRPFDIATENVAPPEKVGGNTFGGMIPYFFLVLCFTGAMYPAMDLTAGEKERGTMETLLCSPVPRITLVLGKFFMVLTASLSTVVCSLCSTTLTLFIAGHVLGESIGGGTGKSGASALSQLGSIDSVGLLTVVAMVVPMAVLFAAVQLSIALFAKSYKEAQSYVSPLVILIVLPAIIGMLPGVELNARLALVPILNVSLVSKELVSGVWHWNLIALIFGSTCVYAAAALAIAVRMFNREDVIFRT